MRWSRRTGSATRGDVGADGTRSVDDQVGVLVPHVKRGGTSYPRKGAGWALEINPFDPTGFKQGVIQARMILTADAGVMRASAFIKSTTIT